MSKFGIKKDIPTQLVIPPSGFDDDEIKEQKPLLLDQKGNYIILKTNNYLYHGSYSLYCDQSKKLKDIPIFLSPNEYNAKDYGPLYKIILDRDYYLLNFDSWNAMNEIYERSPENIQKILIKNYGFYPNKIGEIGERFSVSKEDNELVSFLCGKNYDGYFSQNAKVKLWGKEYGKFHVEIVICHPKNITIQLLDNIDPYKCREYRLNSKKYTTPISTTSRLTNNTSTPGGKSKKSKSKKSKSKKSKYKKSKNKKI
jgi:type IV secretory pathway VirB4 component